uniref:Uncharacterized protein n=1 Tax=Oryza rufipogon TaxID=4529 RepID=A0A0E0RFJ3_ORYRU
MLVHSQIVLPRRCFLHCKISSTPRSSLKRSSAPQSLPPATGEIEKLDITRLWGAEDGEDEIPEGALWSKVEGADEIPEGAL